MPKKSLTELSEADLVKDRKMRFNEDARWRQSCIGPGGYEEMLRWYEATGESVSADGIPEMSDDIRAAINDSVAVAVANVPKARLKPVDPIPVDLQKEIRDILVANQQESANVINRHVDTILSRNHFSDIRAHCVRQAGVYGSGNVLIELDRSVDTRKSIASRKLARKILDGQEFTDEDWALYYTLYYDIGVEALDTPDVFWKRGVKKALSPEMTRVSIVRKADVEAVRIQFNNDNIKPGLPPYYVDTSERPNDTGTTVGVLTTWEIVPRPIRFEQGPEGNPTALLGISDSVLVKTVIAGDVLLDRIVYNGDELGPLCLPVTPYYLWESEKHPYGASIVRSLKSLQKLINALYLQIYQQGVKAAAPQTFFAHMGALGASDSIEEWETKLTQGGIIPVELNDGIEDIRQVIVPASSFADSGLSSAWLQMVSMAEAKMKERSSAPDREAISRARTGTGKRQEIAVADRAKAPMIDLLSRSEESVKEKVFENVRVFHNKERMRVPISSKNSFETVELNVPRRDFVAIPLNHPVDGMPLQHPNFVQPGNEQGYVYQEEYVEYMQNSVDMDMIAQSESRGPLPPTMEARMALLFSMVQSGVIKSARTMRDLVLADELKEIDDANYAADMQEQMLLMAQQMGGQQASPEQVNDQLRDEALPAEGQAFI